MLQGAKYLEASRDTQASGIHAFVMSSNILEMQSLPLALAHNLKASRTEQIYDGEEK